MSELGSKGEQRAGCRRVSPLGGGLWGREDSPGAHNCGLCFPELYLDESKQFYKELGFKR